MRVDESERREPSYIKEQETKADGRYVIYYTFTQPATESSVSRPEQAQAPGGEQKEGADV